MKELKKFFTFFKNNLINTTICEILCSIVSFKHKNFKICVDILQNLFVKLEKNEILEANVEIDENILFLMSKFLDLIDKKPISEMCEIFNLDFFIKVLKNSKHAIKVYVYLILICYSVICKKQKILLSSLTNNSIINTENLIKNLKKNMCNNKVCDLCGLEIINNLQTYLAIENKRKTVSDNMRSIEVEGSITERVSKTNSIGFKNSNFQKYLSNVNYNNKTI